jgi:arylsulfatase A
MNRRKFLQYASAAGLAATIPEREAFGEAGAEAPERPPNIVLILVDDLGWSNLGCYGGEEFETPRIDQLAREGMRFTEGYANCPVCSPSRVAIMTGKYPARVQFTGHITAIDRHRYPENSRILPPADRMDLPLSEVSLAEALQPAGYVSASIGKWHMGHEGYWPENQGFDVNVGGWTHGSPPSYFHPYESEREWNPRIPTLEGGEDGEYLTDRLTDEAIHFVESNRDRPFLLYLTHYGVHRPMQAPQELIDKYTRKFEGRDVGVDPTFAAMVENLDTNTGRLLDALERLELSENTVVIFTSDNGALLASTHNRPLRSGKGFLYEGGIRVPLIIKWPGQIPANTLKREPVMGCDLYPTIVNMAGTKAKPGKRLDGVDLAPLWKGAARLDRDEMYWYYPHYARDMPGAVLRRRDYKLIEYYDPPSVELYNLADDPAEERNLADAMPGMASEMRRAIRRHLDAVNAKLHKPNPGFRKAETGN